MRKIMLIDDEPRIHETMKRLLLQNGYEFCGATEGEEGLALLAQEKPDLLLLDVMLPGVNGFDACRRIREEGRRIPIIFLSAKGDIVDKSVGFRAGGDDYVTKPFDPAEILLRIEANIRRHEDDIDFVRNRNRHDCIRIGEMEVRFDERRILMRGQEVNLTAREFDILAFLASKPEKVFTRNQIQEYIWGKESAQLRTNNVTVFIRKIREKIEHNPSEPEYLVTVQRFGYTIKSPDKLEC